MEVPSCTPWNFFLSQKVATFFIALCVLFFACLFVFITVRGSPFCQPTSRTSLLFPCQTCRESVECTHRSHHFFPPSNHAQKFHQVLNYCGDCLFRTKNITCSLLMGCSSRDMVCGSTCVHRIFRRREMICQKKQKKILENLLMDLQKWMSTYSHSLADVRLCSVCMRCCIFRGLRHGISRMPFSDRTNCALLSNRLSGHVCLL